MEELPPPGKLKNLEEALVFGNHKEAESNPEILRDLRSWKDVTHGYGLVLPLDKLKEYQAPYLHPWMWWNRIHLTSAVELLKKTGSHTTKVSSGALKLQLTAG